MIRGQNLNPRLQRKVDALAEMLGVSQDRAWRIVTKRALAGLPNHAHSSYVLPDLDAVDCCRVSDNLIRMKLSNGRVFFGHRSEQKQYVLHHALKPFLKKKVDGDAYKLALDVQRRYCEQNRPWFFQEGGTYIEGGCYTGIKAIAWSDALHGDARILAVEIGGSNVDILRMNIHANGLENSIVPVHAGLWSWSGEGAHKHNFTTRRFLEETDRWSDHMIHEEPVALLSVDDLLAQHDVDVVEFLNVQVNGAEMEVLKGARSSLDRIKVVSVAAYYGQNGEPNAPCVRRFLEEQGCEILYYSKAGRVTAITPKFRKEILARGPENQSNHTLIDDSL